MMLEDSFLRTLGTPTGEPTEGPHEVSALVLELLPSSPAGGALFDILSVVPTRFYAYFCCNWMGHQEEK